MCGIFGVIGSKNSYEEIKGGLERIAYRGYDSAGLVTLNDNSFFIEKVEGHPENLPSIDGDEVLGIGHCRWATHSPPTKENAHPYLSNDGAIALVHNGIVENYPDVRKFLADNGFDFYSSTDTEVLPNLIQYYLDNGLSIQKAIMMMTEQVRGAYAVAFLHLNYPDTIFVARHGSPLYIGKGRGKYFISSDITSMPDEIKKVIALDNDRFAVIKKNSINIKAFKGQTQKIKYEIIEKESNIYNLDEYSSFLKKEIFEQPFYIKNAIAGRIAFNPPDIKLSGINEYIEELSNADEIVFTGCGSAFYAAQIAAHAMESVGRVRSRALNAGELQYFNPIITPNTFLISISQSGETADTIGCINFYKSKGAKVLGITNVVNSTISRLVDAGIYIRAGQEVSVASTKALVNQIINLLLMAYLVGKKNNLSNLEYESFISEINKLPSKVKDVLEKDSLIKDIASSYFKSNSLICIGRGTLETVAYETSLKVKEISYIHAEGYSGAELKHGPLALISEDTPTIAFVQSGLLGEKNMSNIQEIKSRKGPVIVVTDESFLEKVINISDHAVFIKELENEYLNSILYLVVGQLFAYNLARLLNRSIDRPRNLAKSVTVE